MRLSILGSLRFALTAAVALAAEASSAGTKTWAASA